jgi:RNA polymerase sigma-70 factor (ECF subfamily)
MIFIPFRGQARGFKLYSLCLLNFDESGRCYGRMTTEESKNMSLKIAGLAEKAMAGNRGSFQELMTMLQGDIYRLAYYRTFSQMDAEDITQEVFVQAYKKIKTLNDPQRFRAWLYTIAVNRCNDFLRKKKYLFLLQSRSAQEQEFVEADKMDNDYTDAIAKKKFWEQVRLLLDKLSTMERQVFTLRFMDHRNINDIATILGKNESTVKTHLYRALNKVREESLFFQEYRELIS